MTEVEDAEESVDSLLLQWYSDTDRLRGIAYGVRRLAAEISGPYHADIDESLPWVVEQFLAISAAVDRAKFEHPFFATVGLHNRGVGVFNPDHGPTAEPTPFVRQMPDKQPEVEGKRFERQVRHVAAYEIHIAESMRHFEQACNAMTDGALAGDLAMIEDEFPKLADTAAEVRKAYKIWTSING